ncbi:signal transduction histidine kinase [Maribacter caenipelagi]|uniref:histidine kinase n=1 Tax=Maribacter caenipelagi TaxID=1447781 RepID=A0A4R7DB27_9FLAO|nr:sensor histidine kinase [Maribacter caenipelagi]TDS17084.1 signal transduction histidine kinase [Maribacter caenipelagi]
MWKRVFKMFIGLYVPLFALNLFLYYSQKAKQIEAIMERQIRANTMKKVSFEEECHSFLRNTHYWATLKYPKNFDPLVEHSSFLRSYLELIEDITSYDQFRFIDLEGKEFFRAERVGNDSIIISAIQNKNYHPYVKAGLQLKRNQIYLSQISLNKENGEIEKPHKPVIRTVAPIFDNEQNQIGLVVINFKMKKILDQIKSTVEDKNVYLLDEDFRVITSSTIKEDLPYESGNKNSTIDGILNTKAITHIRDSTFVENGHIWSQQSIKLNGATFTYGSISNLPTEIVTPSNWLMALEIPPRLVKAVLQPVFESLLIFNIISIIGLFVFSHIYLKNRIEKEQFYKELESKNILLTRSKDQLEENNVMVNEMNNSLEIKNKQLSDFNYLISHNLRSPVTSMSVIVDMIRKEKNPELLNQLLPKLDKVAKSITHLTEDINDYVAILDNKEIKIVDIDLKELILEVKHEFTETLLDNSGFEVQLNLAAWNHISYSKFYLQSIVHNFISNAIKYKRDNVDSHIQFESALENKQKVLYVRDNGIGLNLDRHGDNVFKLYKRFHRNISGKGMGLFLVKSQLEALNATITIDSKVGEGTTFKLIFEK